MSCFYNLLLISPIIDIFDIVNLLSSGFFLVFAFSETCASAEEHEDQKLPELRNLILQFCMVN